MSTQGLSQVGDESNYAKYRGKCRELSEAAVAADPTLRLVRGYYTCPMWGTKEPHWWTVRPDGTIHDPTCLQFPSGGLGDYEEFNGMFNCSNCDKTVAEADVIPYGNYVFCSDSCVCQFVGVG